MEIRQLRYFAAVAGVGSFSQAAQVLHVAQSALSHQIMQLERELGISLLHRLSRGTALTEAGHVFLAHTLTILRQLEDARLSVHSTPDQLKGKVTVGLPSSICNALAVPLLNAMRNEMPGVDLELTEQASGNLAAQLQSSLLNLAVLFDDGDLDKYLRQPLVDEQLFLISREPIKSERRDAVTLRQALERPLMLASQQQGVRRIIERAAKEHRLPRPNVIAELNSVSILRSAVIAGISSTILPPMSLQHELAAGLLHGRPICNPSLTRRVSICASAVIPMSPATLAVFKLIRRLAQELSQTGCWRDAVAVTSAS